MRLDQFLTVCRLATRRPQAKALCDRGAVCLNGRPAKAAQEVKTGDGLELALPHVTRVYRVVSVPAGRNVSRLVARTLIEPLGETPEEHFP